VKTLILGANGMLGQELVRAFSDCDILAWDREELDVTDAEAVRAMCTSARPDVIINAVANNAVDAIEGDPSSAMAVNGAASGTLASAAASISATFVHYSTDYVFDGARREGYAESDAPNPLSAYGQSKLAGEQALLAVAVRHPGWRWYLIRTSRLFGRPAVSPNAKRSFVDTMIALSATKDRLELIDEEVSSPTYAPDLAVATREIVGLQEKRPQGSFPMTPGVYHRTNDGSCTWFGFAKEIFRITGWRGSAVPVPASAFPRPAKRPAFSVLRTTKLPPMRRWEEALAEYLSKISNDEFLISKNP